MEKVVVVVVIVAILAAVVWNWWRCRVTVTIGGLTSGISPNTGGSIAFTATYAASKGHAFTSASPVTVTVTYSNPSAGSIGVASAAARPTISIGVVPNPAGGQDATISVGAYPTGGIFDITVTAKDDNGDSGSTTLQVR